jgi:hypothetical protein
MLIVLALTTSPSVYGESIAFTVVNNTAFDLTELQISSDKASWSAFRSVDLKAGKSAVFDWDITPKSTCTQYIRGKFGKARWSSPVETDFCESLPVQIAFN